MVDNWSGLVEKVAFSHGKLKLGVIITLEKLNRSNIVLSSQESTHLERIKRKLTHALNMYHVGENRYCQDEDCRTSQKIIFVREYALLPDLNKPGIKVGYECGHQRVYEISDEAFPTGRRDDPFPTYNSENHHMAKIIYDMIESRRKSA